MEQLESKIIAEKRHVYGVHSFLSAGGGYYLELPHSITKRYPHLKRIGEEGRIPRSERRHFYSTGLAFVLAVLEGKAWSALGEVEEKGVKGTCLPGPFGSRLAAQRSAYLCLRWLFRGGVL
jgi:hypothetical protein